jgi:hypothetical protein
VTFAAAPELASASATVGAVTVRVPGTARYTVYARTTVGHVNVSVPRGPSRQPHVIRATTRTGSITIAPAP